MKCKVDIDPILFFSLSICALSSMSWCAAIFWACPCHSLHFLQTFHFSFQDLSHVIYFSILGLPLFLFPSALPTSTCLGFLSSDILTTRTCSNSFFILISYLSSISIECCIYSASIVIWMAYSRGGSSWGWGCHCCGWACDQLNWHWKWTGTLESKIILSIHIKQYFQYTYRRKAYHKKEASRKKQKKKRKKRRLFVSEKYLRIKRVLILC